MITLHESAKEKITDLYIDENDTTIKGLRVFVQGGGCSGFSYGFTWDWEKNEDDFEFAIDEKLQVLIDASSMQYLQGSTIKFKTELSGANFVIENPNATNKCGCGYNTSYISISINIKFCCWICGSNPKITRNISTPSNLKSL